MTDFDEAIKRRPDNFASYLQRGIALKALGRAEEAQRDYETVLRLVGSDAEVCNAVAWSLAASPELRFRNAESAVGLATRACELANWSNPSFLDTLAAAHAEAGNFAEAIGWQEKTLAMIAPADPNASGMRERLALYQKGIAYHDKH